ncbi:hypothetical protein BV378_35725 [Nostoc sp. RF31YmG]|nr:hypothetical protein BV378_35725 [Nostoc sp. RF31YmG]
MRNVKPVNNDENLQEIELLFTDTKIGEKNRLFISGINFKELPRLPISDERNTLIAHFLVNLE